MKNTFDTNITQNDIQSYILFQFDILSLSLAKYDFTGMLDVINLVKSEFKKQSDLRKQMPCTVINIPVEQSTILESA